MTDLHGLLDAHNRPDPFTARFRSLIMCRSTAEGGRRCPGHHHTTTRSTTTPATHAATAATSTGLTATPTAASRVQARAELDEAVRAVAAPSSTPYLVTALARRAEAVRSGRDGSVFDSEVELGRAMLRSRGADESAITRVERAHAAAHRG